MKSIWKKFISVFFAIVVAVGCLPSVSALAEEASESTEEVYESAEEAVESSEGEAESTEEDTGSSEESSGASSEIFPSAGDENWPSAPTVDAECAILMDADTGAVLYSKNPDRQMYPASITKIMTALLALENSSMDETVTFSYDAVYKNETDSSHIARDVDEQMTMEETLYAVMLESANECAYAVAEHVGGGDYETFIDMMNERAAELGCTNTHFTNANGLPDEEHVTTARDMALISQEAIKNSEFREIIGTVQYVIPPTNIHDDPTYLNNHNKMINDYKGSEHLYEYCIGGKTGYTQAAGNTLVTFAEKDDKLLIAVVLRSSGIYDDCETMFEYGFNNFTHYNIAANENRYGEEAGEGALFDPDYSYVEIDPDAEITLPDGVSFFDADAAVSYDNASEDVLGTLTYYYDGEEVGSADIYITGTNEEALATVTSENKGDAGSRRAERKAEKAESGSRLSRGAKWAIAIVIIVVAILVILYAAARIRRNRRRRRRRKSSQGYSKGRKAPPKKRR